MNVKQKGNMNIPNKTFRYNKINWPTLKLNRILSDLAGIIPVLFCQLFQSSVKKQQHLCGYRFFRLVGGAV